jgi:nitrogenase molybdenum-iron protein NifN
MARIIRRHKALAVRPLKTSPVVGAALALLGVRRSLAMLHGAQGCTAFSKIFLIQHFREPMPLQTTAMDQVSTIMGSEENVVEGLATLCRKSRPGLIGIPTTGLSETQGSNVASAVKQFRQMYPEWGRVAIVPISTPDYTGALETGYANAVQALIEALVPERFGGHRPQLDEHGRWRVNVLVGSLLTPGDGEALRELIEAFGLHPVLVPDLADSLDGHLGSFDFSPTTIGGTQFADFDRLGDALATLVVGPSLYPAALSLKARTGVPEYRFDHLLGLEATDRLLMVLKALSGRPVPAHLERHRSQLQDAMLDTHFVLSGTRVALGLDPDLLLAMSQLFTSMGAEIVAPVASTNAVVFEAAILEEVKIGDLEDLGLWVGERQAELIVGNSHAAAIAKELDVPLLRVGFPLYDRFGATSRTVIGYRGTRALLFEAANCLLERDHTVAPYRSVFSQKNEHCIGNIDHAPRMCNASRG